MNRTAHIVLAVLGLGTAVFGQQPAIDGVVEGAGFTAAQPLGIGSAVSIFGTGLAAAVLAGDTVPLSNTIGETSVTVNGISAPLYFVSPGQINIQVPWNALADGLTTGMGDIVVTRAGAQSAAKQVPLSSISPAIFAVGAAGSQFAIAVNLADGSLAAPEGVIPGLLTRPAKAGEFLIIYANGLGPVDSPIANGADSLDKLRNTLTVPVVRIGGVQAQVLFSGLTPQFPGINQLNIQIPAGVSVNDRTPITLESGGITSPSTTVVAIGN